MGDSGSACKTFSTKSASAWIAFTCSVRCFITERALELAFLPPQGCPAMDVASRPCMCPPRLCMRPACVPPLHPLHARIPQGREYRMRACQGGGGVPHETSLFRALRGRPCMAAYRVTTCPKPSAQTKKTTKKTQSQELQCAVFSDMLLTSPDRGVIKCRERILKVSNGLKIQPHLTASRLPLRLRY
jgi:hypothetical protein